MTYHIYQLYIILSLCIGMLASEFGKERIKKDVDKIVEKCNQKCRDKEKKLKKEEPTSIVEDFLNDD